MPSRMLGILEHYCACSTNLFEKCIRTFFPWSDTCSSFASFHSVLIASWCICTRIVSFKWKSEFLDLKFLEVCQNPVISFSCIPGIVVLLWNIVLFVLVVLITCLNFFTSNFPWLGVFLCLPRSTILDRVVTVEYAFRDDDNERDDRYSSPKRGGHDRRRASPYMRSPSPRYRRDYSPNYDRRGRYPGYDRRDGVVYDRRSPVYDRYDRGRSPAYDRYDRRSPGYDQY